MKWNYSLASHPVLSLPPPTSLLPPTPCLPYHDGLYSSNAVNFFSKLFLNMALHHNRKIIITVPGDLFLPTLQDGGRRHPKAEGFSNSPTNHTPWGLLLGHEYALVILQLVTLTAAG